LLEIYICQDNNLTNSFLIVSFRLAIYVYSLLVFLVFFISRSRSVVKSEIIIMEVRYIHQCYKNYKRPRNTAILERQIELHVIFFSNVLWFELCYEISCINLTVVCLIGLFEISVYALISSCILTIESMELMLTCHV